MEIFMPSEDTYVKTWRSSGFYNLVVKNCRNLQFNSVFGMNNATRCTNLTVLFIHMSKY